MKRVLWVCNIMLPVIAKQLGLPFSNREGWLTGIFEQLLKETDKEIALGICFPVESLTEKYLVVKGVPCYAFEENLSHPECYEQNMEDRFAEIFADFKPDMIHVFGTEFPHALAAVKTFAKPEATLVGIQGLCGEIAKAYMANLPEKVRKQVSFRDFIRKDSLYRQQQKFVIRGKREKEVIEGAGHITGRTEFDKAGTKKINPGAVYHPMNETMRSSFYTGSWSYEQCEKHSIFMGQGDYPLKGFHFMLEAMPILLKKYPDAVLYIAGNSIINHSTWKEKMKLSAYGKYLLGLIRKFNLEKKVIVLGKLTEEEMKQQFLKSGVFVCPSILENSPNTIGEAMLLGVPVVAAKVGGIPDMITDGRDGLLFEGGNVQALAEAIDLIFHESALRENIVKAAKDRAHKVHDGNANYQRLMEIYAEIGEGR